MKISFENYNNRKNEDIHSIDIIDENDIECILEEICVSLVLNTRVKPKLFLDNQVILLDGWDLHSFIMSFKELCGFLFIDDLTDTLIELYDQGTMIKLELKKSLEDVINITGHKISEESQFVGSYSINQEKLQKNIKVFFKEFDKLVKEELPLIFGMSTYSIWRDSVQPYLSKK